MKILRIVLLLVLVPVSGYLLARQKTKTQPKPAGLATTVASGRRLYVQYCLTCHQADGGGVQNMNPPLIKTTFVLGDKKRLAKIILNGFNEQVEIEGETYSNIMPALNYLTDKQIADVLTYVRNSFGNKASAVTAAEVKQARASK